jgi:6-phospho-beta-glucosidase
MKLACIGGAGVRAPLLIGSLAKRADTVGLGELAIYDIDPRKVALILPLGRALLDAVGNPYKLTVCQTPQEAIAGADAVITTIRSGFEIGRARDERICVNHGVIGQETTGPAGFAYAARSIPDLVGYARMMMDLCPDAWLLNFTNPAGLVTQALQREGFERAIGICDSADTAKMFAGDHLKLEKSALDSRVIGLNHLSVTTQVNVDGRDVLPELLADDRFLKNAQPVFEPSQVRELGLYLNEYLYYFLRKEHALHSMLAEPKTRGELIVGWNAELLETLDSLDLKNEAQTGLDRYMAYTHRRNASYMDYATGGERYLPTDDEEGYAGVALDFIAAMRGTGVRHQAFCVPNGEVLPELEADDIIEVTCEIANGRLKPLPAGPLPKRILDLIMQVKSFERVAADAILNRSIDAAVEALSLNPLVPDVDTAAVLFGDFAEAQPGVFEGWE